MKILAALVIIPVFSLAIAAQSDTIGSSTLARSFHAGRISFVWKTNSSAELERRAFELINERRREAGLLPLEWNDRVAAIARAHSQHMAATKFFSHKDRNGLLVNDRADKLGVSNWRAIGENIAFNRGFDDPVTTAVANWMDSRGHRENLLNNDWTESGIGLAIAGDGSYYFTQVFVLRK
jgi:uncharacterized protein YkwD